MGKITYEFKIENGERLTFQVDPDKPNNDGVAINPRAPSWTALDYCKCENCPLSIEEHAHCPVALDIEDIAGKFSEFISWKKAEVWVHTNGRSYFKECDLQNGLRSILGLIMALSTCPILSKLKPLAQNHLPFASFKETVSRVVGNYLTRQFLHGKDGLHEPDWDLKELKEMYKELATVNLSLLERVKAACQEDANLNAISIFFSVSSVVNMALEDQLNEMKDSFLGSKTETTYEVQEAKVLVG